MDVCNDESTNVSSKSNDIKEMQDNRITKDNQSKNPLRCVDLSMLNDPMRYDKRSTVDSVLTTQSPLPAVFDKFTLPSCKIEKVDVAKYLSKHDLDNQKTDDDDDDYETMSSGIDDALTDYIVGKDRKLARDPRNSLSSMVEKVTKELQNKQQPFEFFTRHIPETSHPTPESLDVKSEPTSTSKHRSIYESSSPPLRSDDHGITTTKDKDMRLSSLFMDDMSNGKFSPLRIILPLFCGLTSVYGLLIMLMSKLT